ncbi:MAG: hypothetical protein ACRC0G_16735 [Fusobacteriaceae bacterium]
MAKYNLKRILMNEYNVEASVATSFTNYIGRILGLTAVTDSGYNNILLVDKAPTKDEFLKSVCERMLTYLDTTSDVYKAILAEIEEKYTKPHPAVEELRKLKEQMFVKEEEIANFSVKLNVLTETLESVKNLNKTLEEYVNTDSPLGRLVEFIKENQDFVVSCKEMRDSYFKETVEVKKQIIPKGDGEWFRLTDEELMSLGNIFLSSTSLSNVNFQRASVVLFGHKNKSKICLELAVPFELIAIKNGKKGNTIKIKRQDIDLFVERFNAHAYNHSKKKVGIKNEI